jgi:hypothetical protein
VSEKDGRTELIRLVVFVFISELGQRAAVADRPMARLVYPAPEIAGAFRYLRFVPGGDHGEDIPGQRLRAKLGITPVEYFSPEVAQGRKLAVMT